MMSTVMAMVSPCSGKGFHAMCDTSCFCLCHCFASGWRPLCSIVALYGGLVALLIGFLNRCYINEHLWLQFAAFCMRFVRRYSEINLIPMSSELHVTEQERTSVSGPEEPPTLYMCLKIGQFIDWSALKDCPMTSYIRTRLKPEYWFTIPSNRYISQEVLKQIQTG